MVAVVTSPQLLDLSIYLSIYLQAWKRSYSARLPQLLTLTASKKKQVCKTSAVFQLDNVKNEAILGVVNIKNNAILRDSLQTWKVECKANGLVPMRFFHSTCLKYIEVLRLQRRSDARSYEVLHLSPNHLPKTEDLTLQNATPLRKSAPGPPNSSDEHVSCTALATQNVFLQIPFKCPTPANVFGTATNPSRFAHSWEGAESLAPATPSDTWTSKSGPSMVVLLVFFNVSNILTWKCASRHHAVPFFDVSTSKSAPRIVCCTFWLGNVLRATTACKFQYLNFQKCLKPAVFCTFWLRNVLRATTACNFSFLIWPDGSAPAALASLLFDPPKPQIIGKTQCFATLLPFRAPASSVFASFSSLIFFLLLFSSLLWLFPPLLFHLSMLSEVWLLNFLRWLMSIYVQEL